MIFLIIALFIAALALLFFALRGQRLDDHPLCGKCGFDLIGVYPANPTCPECGATTTEPRRALFRRAGVRIGNRRTRRRLALASAFVLLVCLAGADFIGWSYFSSGTLNSHKPTWWLLLDIRARAAPDIDAALLELETRQTLGQLSESDMNTIVELGLKWQADADLPWLQRWGDLIEIAWRADKLTEAQKTEYATNAAHLTLSARERVRHGETLPTSVEITPRVGSGQLFSFWLEMRALTMGEQPLDVSLVQSVGAIDPPLLLPGVASRNAITLNIVPNPSSFVPAPIKQPPGTYVLTCSCRLAITTRDSKYTNGYSVTWVDPRENLARPRNISMLSRSSGVTTHVERAIDVSTSVMVVPADEETVELVKNEALADSIRRTITVRIYNEPPRPYNSGGIRASFMVSPPPMDLAFDAVIRAPDGTETRATLTGETRSGGTNWSSADITNAKASDVYDVTLTPSRAVARQTVGIERIWGEPIVFKGLSVEDSPYSSYTSPVAGDRVQVLGYLKRTRSAFPDNCPFRAAALRMPYVYVGDRCGNVHVFRVDDNGAVPTKTEVKLLKNAGDGNDLKIVGDVLLCCKHGRLAAFSLADPENPKPLESDGPPDKFYTSSIVIAESRAFLLGAKIIICFDIADPSRPRFVSTTESADWLCAGCVIGGHLFAATLDPKGDNEGIACFDITDPLDIQRVSFTPTQRGTFAVYALPGQRLLTTLDAESLSLIGQGPHGSSLIFDVADPLNLKLLGTNTNASGRTSAVLTLGKDAYLACPGAVLKIDGSDVKHVGVVYAASANLDGAPYHGDANGNHAAIVQDDCAIVIQLHQAPRDNAK